MSEVRWWNNPVVFSPTEPSSSMVSELGLWPSTNWRWFNIVNRRWYEFVGGSWVLCGETGLTGEFEGTIKKIKV